LNNVLEVKLSRIEDGNTSDVEAGGSVEYYNQELDDLFSVINTLTGVDSQRMKIKWKKIFETV